MIDTVARGLPAEACVGRTAAQTRADVFGDIVTQLAAFGRVDLRSAPAENAETCDAAEYSDGCDTDAGAERLLPVAWEALGASVTVVVAADVFAGCTGDDLGSLETALLERYGDLPADLAHALAVSARRARVWITGTQSPPPAGPDGRPMPVPELPSEAVPDAGHEGQDVSWMPDGEQQVGHWVYRPDRDTAERVIERDRVCRFPGCRRPARQCDLDHRIPFDEGGSTSVDNLDVLCRYHHRIKTHAGWRSLRLPGNRMRWTSPLGAVLVDEPEVDVDSCRSTAEPVPTPDPDADPPPF